LRFEKCDPIESEDLMSTNASTTSLEVAGLSISKVLDLPDHVVNATPAGHYSLSVLMRNDVQFSHISAPSIATAHGRLELIRVQLHQDMITIADVWGVDRDKNGQTVERIGARLYGLKTVSLDGVTTYMFMSKLPGGIVDDKFFPAEGTAAFFDDFSNGRRVLKACGFDRNSGQAQGWIFHAMET
jgi:hypothetical protein